ncbi:MAG TPA: hypothetical protein VMT36_03165 [Candidatus Saccharimonadia bacterium]|nr:hypothetical protein [Candidatus Saccharimonadia bacterium]
MTQPTGSEGQPDAPPPGSDNTRLESLMAEVPPSTPGWSAPPSRTPMIALWLGVGAFVAAWAVVIDLALVRQGQRSIVAGGILGIVLLVAVGAAISAIIGAVRVRSSAYSDAHARTRAAIAAGLAAVALLLMTLAGLELYSIGLDAF